MATLVKFYTEPKYGDVIAYFPQFNYNKVLYGNNMKVSYEHTGQHSACSPEYVKECRVANHSQYVVLLRELQSIGYDNLRVLNKN